MSFAHSVLPGLSNADSEHNERALAKDHVSSSIIADFWKMQTPHEVAKICLKTLTKVFFVDAAMEDASNSLNGMCKMHYLAVPIKMSFLC